MQWADSHYDPKLGSSRTGEQVALGLAKSLASMRATAVVESAAAREQALAMNIDTKGMNRSAAWVWFPEGYAAADRGDSATADSTSLRIANLTKQPHEPEAAPNENNDYARGRNDAGLAQRRCPVQTRLATGARPAARRADEGGPHT